MRKSIHNWYSEIPLLFKSFSELIEVSNVFWELLILSIINDSSKPISIILRIESLFRISWAIILWKEISNVILSMIMSVFELDAKLVSKIKEYQSKEGLQNEKGLDRYIDKILTEKAEKKWKTNLFIFNCTYSKWSGSPQRLTRNDN